MTKSVRPGTTSGQLQWTCGSMPPGITYCPVASTVRAAPVAAKPPGAPIATILPPAIARWPASGPDGRTAKPPATMTSNMRTSRGDGLGGLDRRRAPRRRAGEGEPVEDSVERNRVHDEYQPAAAHTVRPSVEPDWVV